MIIIPSASLLVERQRKKEDFLFFMNPVCGSPGDRGNDNHVEVGMGNPAQVPFFPTWKRDTFSWNVFLLSWWTKTAMKKVLFASHPSCGVLRNVFFFLFFLTRSPQRLLHRVPPFHDSSHFCEQGEFIY